MHTADLHIGLKFNSIKSQTVRDQLIQERLDSLERMIQSANQKECDFLVIAGDLFDKTDVPKKDIDKTIKLLQTFHQDVLVLPGNHDFIVSQSGLWNYFYDKSQGSNIKLFFSQEVYTVEKENRNIHFYACPCPSKHSSEHVIGWVAEIEKHPSDIHIGIAHGNVEGLGLDGEGKYFNMSEAELNNAGVDTWLLGHIHVPFPSPDFVGKPYCFMPGTHAPENIKRKFKGQAWCISIDDDKNISFEQIRTGKLSFFRTEKSLNNLSDVQLLLAEMNELENKHAMIVEYKLSGSLSVEDIELLNQGIDQIKNEFLELTVNTFLTTKIDMNMIRNEIPEGTFAYQLFSSIDASADEDKELEMEIAYDIIQTLK